MILKYLLMHPTDSSTVLEPQDQEIGEFYVAPLCRETDFRCKKL